MAFGLTNNDRANLPFKYIFGRSQVRGDFDLGNEPYGIFSTSSSDYVWTSVISSNRFVSMSASVSIEVDADLIAIPNSQIGSTGYHAYYSSWPITVPSGVDAKTGNPYVYNVGSLSGITAGSRVFNCISPSYNQNGGQISDFASGYTARLFSDSGLTQEIDLLDDRNWVFQYQSGIYYEAGTGGSFLPKNPVPKKIKVWAYIGNTLTNALNVVGASNLQQAYNNSTYPEILTNNTLGGITIRRGSVSDSDNLIEFQNGTGNTVASINALGVGTFNSIILSGGTFSGDGSGLFNIPASGITGLQLDRISSGANSAIMALNGLIVNTGITAYNYIVSGGTSSQFLKADGTLDSNLYLTTSGATGTYLPLSGGTLTGGLTGTTISVDRIKPNTDSTTGLTFTKADGITTVMTVDTANNSVIVNNQIFSRYYKSSDYLNVQAASDWLYLFGFEGITLSTTDGEAFRILKTRHINTLAGKYQYNATSPTSDTIDDIRIFNTGGTWTIQGNTVSGSTKGSGTWVDRFKVDSSGNADISGNLNLGNAKYLKFNTDYFALSGGNGTTNFYGGNGIALKGNANANIEIPNVLLVGYTGTSTYKLSVSGTTLLNGDTTVIGNITGSTFVVSGGTSSQFLKADGTLDSNLYLTTSGGTITGNFIVSGGTLNITSISVTGITSGLTPYTVFSVDKLTCSALFFDYFIKETNTNAFRSGTVMCVQDGINTSYTETSTSDLNASTSGLSFSTQIIDSNIVLIASVTGGSYNIKCGIRKL